MTPLEAIGYGTLVLTVTLMLATAAWDIHQHPDQPPEPPAPRPPTD